MAALKYWVWLTTLTGVSEDTRLRLLQAFSSPEEIYFADKGDLALVKDIKKEELAALENRSLDEAERILEKCGKKEIFVVTYADALYPQRLKNIYHPPLLLYGKGKMPLFDEEAAVAVVGTRKCTPYGIRCAQELGYEISQQGGVVISGMARGIDAAAMEGALRFGGFTCGVLGGGVDVIYPPCNRRLYEDVAATGVLLSEYPPGTPIPSENALAETYGIHRLSVRSAISALIYASGGELPPMPSDKEAMVYTDEYWATWLERNLPEYAQMLEDVRNAE